MPEEGVDLTSESKIISKDHVCNLLLNTDLDSSNYGDIHFSRSEEDQTHRWRGNC